MHALFDSLPLRHVQWCGFAVRNSKIIVGENQTFQGPEEYVRSRGVELMILREQACIDQMQEFITQFPDLWNEDIGV